MSAGPTKREALSLRVRPGDRGLIDRAAQALGKTRTDFILDAARLAAEEALLDRAAIEVDPAAYADFLSRLEAPARPNDRLLRTMRTYRVDDGGAPPLGRPTHLDKPHADDSIIIQRSR